MIQCFYKIKLKMLEIVICFMFVLDLSLGSICYQYSNDGATADQLVSYKERTKGCGSYLTTSYGRPLGASEASETINGNIITNDRFIESLGHFVREPVLHRVVHDKGGGAYGYFEVTHNVSDVICVDMFQGIGKKTQVTVRFSSSSEDAGGADTVRDLKGFAVKFNTPQGNFDLLSINIDAFPIKDPIKFPDFSHANGRNPQTNKKDQNMLWDFIIHNPESINFILRLFSDQGIPSSYTKMSGHPIHTFKFCDCKGNVSFGRFSIEPDSGKEYLSSENATYVSGINRDYLNQDLFDRIDRGEAPSWTLYVQLITDEAVSKSSINVFDLTFALDPKIFISRPIGKIYLNRNPKNFLRDIESLGFSVRNLVDGICAADTMFEGRAIVYNDALNHRLGANFNKIPANLPIALTRTYNRGGVQPINCEDDDSPNYYPNSFNGPVAKAKTLCDCTKDYNVYVDPKPTNFKQASDYFDYLQEDEKDRLAKNIATSLGETTALFLREEVVKLFTQINKMLSLKVKAGLAANRQGCKTNDDTKIIRYNQTKNKC